MARKDFDGALIRWHLSVCEGWVDKVSNERLNVKMWYTLYNITAKFIISYAAFPSVLHNKEGKIDPFQVILFITLDDAPSVVDSFHPPSVDDLVSVAQHVHVVIERTLAVECVALEFEDDLILH